MFTSKSVLENNIDIDKFWVAMGPHSSFKTRKQFWKHIESYLFVMCLVWFMPGKRFITKSSNPH